MRTLLAFLLVLWPVWLGASEPGLQPFQMYLRIGDRLPQCSVKPTLMELIARDTA